MCANTSTKTNTHGQDGWDGKKTWSTSLLRLKIQRCRSMKGHCKKKKQQEQRSLQKGKETNKDPHPPTHCLGQAILVIVVLVQIVHGEPPNRLAKRDGDGMRACNTGCCLQGTSEAGRAALEHLPVGLSGCYPRMSPASCALFRGTMAVAASARRPPSGRRGVTGQVMAGGRTK